MKIGINLLPFRTNLTGTGVYAYNILLEICQIDPKNEYCFFTNRESEKTFNFQNKNIKTITLPFRAHNVYIRIFWEQFVLPFYLKKQKINVLFSPSVVLPVLSKCKNVICIHDLIPFHLNGKYTLFRSFYIKIMTRVSARKADHILTVSQNSKAEIRRFCGVSADKISVGYNSINLNIKFPEVEKWDSFQKANGIPQKYLLFVGTLEPGKNLIVLIRSFKLLIEKYNVNHKLVIAGGKGWLYKKIFQEVKSQGLTDRVIFTGYVPDKVLGALYKNADVFTLPSLYEGFGIPVLEAMYFGTPVIVSNRSSLPEVVGKAGLIIDPDDETLLAESINNIIKNYDLRNNLIKKGFMQANKFSWNKTARIAMDTFNKVA